MVLLQPPLPTSAPVSVVRSPAPPLYLPSQIHSHVDLYLWDEEGLNAFRVPYLICVLEGEADFKTGVICDVRQKNDDPALTAEREIVTLCKNMFLLVPPGVSTAHLDRICHAETGMPVMKYVTHYCIEPG